MAVGGIPELSSRVLAMDNLFLIRLNSLNDLSRIKAASEEILFTCPKLLREI